MFTNVRFFKDIRLNPQGSIHLGYVQHCVLNAMVQVEGADGQLVWKPIKIGLPDMAVRLQRPRESDGKRVLRFEVPSTVKQIPNRQNGGVPEDRRIDHYHPADADTRVLFTRALGTHSDIVAAAREALAALKAGALQVQSAPSVGAQVSAGATPFDEEIAFACGS